MSGDPLMQFVLVINCGSSSLKFALFSTRSDTLTCQAEGLAESLGSEQARCKIRCHSEDLCVDLAGATHKDAIQHIVNALEKQFDLKGNLTGIGHRVVHGGEQFSASTIIDAQVYKGIQSCSSLAPLHNPANLQGIDLARELFPDTQHVAVFDTAFHQTMPKQAFVYGLPYELYEDKGVRRYGFHGTSHRYVSLQASQWLKKPIAKTHLVTAHLGNGASVCAIKDGLSVDTSMGMTPLEGLIMGTRSGDIDPGIFDFLIQSGHSPERINTMLNRESGLLGISGNSNDMRTLLDAAEQGCERSALAIDVFCFRLAKYIAAMMVSLTSLDALVFTGGIGENSDSIRAKTVAHLQQFSLALNPERNADRSFSDTHAIHSVNSRPILVIATDEESMIAQDTFALTQNQA